MKFVLDCRKINS